MGTDLTGGVEFRLGGVGGPWELTDLSVDCIGRDYDAFGLFFGVRNYAGFAPIAAGRGLPDDASAELLDLINEPVYDRTFITAADLAAVDWNKKALTTDGRMHDYAYRDGQLVEVGKGFPGDRWQEVAGPDAPRDGRYFPEGTEWVVGERIYRVERLVQCDVLRHNSGLRELVASMLELGRSHGGQNVRLVVWFDQPAAADRHAGNRPVTGSPRQKVRVFVWPANRRVGDPPLTGSPRQSDRFGGRADGKSA